MIGLVLGETQLGNLIIKSLKNLKVKYVIIDISQKKIFKNKKNSHQLSIGQLGKAISIFKKNNCKKIIFAGKVIRPNFLKTKFDFKALYYLPKIIKASKKGDAYIIKEIIKIFKKEKIKVIRQNTFNPELTLNRGIFTRCKPDKISKKDIILGKTVISDLKKNNVGQGIVISNNRIIAVEDENGTDSMLLRASKIFKKSNKKKRQGILLKYPKTNQDLRIDLPTVGVKTLRLCVKIGLKGIALKSKYNIFINKKKIINYANSKKLFITVK
jgi:UDP-2,3-diacylglucosamine hydrolase